MRALSLCAALLACSACGFGHDVGADGKYEIVPPTAVTDSAPYPLANLLFVQRDVDLGQTRAWLFRGDLRSADLGIEDLRRIAARHGGFQIAFDPTRKSFQEDDPVKSHGKALDATVGDRALSLARLDNDGLQKSGATRWLSSVTSTDYDVAAYFGVIDSGDTFSPIRIPNAGIDYDSDDEAPGLEFDRDDKQVRLQYQSTADYVVVELVQPITKKSEEDGKREEDDDADEADLTLDGLVRTSLEPGTAYQVTPPLLTDVAGQGCWSRQRTIEARLHQISRRYQQRARGDWAVVYERIDTIEVSVDDWTALLGDPMFATYCKDYE
jgi:hypothetical protein